MTHDVSSTGAPFDVSQWMQPEVADDFFGAMTRRSYSGGETIYTQGDLGTDMYRLVRGSVRLSVSSSDGREVLYLFFEPGDCFGDSSLVDQEPRPQTAEALGETEVQILSRTSYLHLREKHPQIDQALLRLFSRQMRLMIAHVADAHLFDLPTRVASRIVATAMSFGVQTPAGLALSVPLSQSEIASMVGASRQTVNRVLQQFQSEGLISTAYGSLVVRDMERLRRKARPEG